MLRHLVSLKLDVLIIIVIYFLGSSIGIILPSDADDEVFDLLESILYGIISQPTGEAIAEWRSRKEAGASIDYSTRISDKLINGKF